jgi:Tol biopolymer transport system component
LKSALGKIGLITGSLSALAWVGSLEPHTSGLVIPAPPMALPAYLTPTTDPVTGYTFVRATNPGFASGTKENCGKAYCTHRYSSSQAWNADQTLLLISNGCGGLCFIDGHTYVPLFRRQRSGECEWHPKTPDLMICVAGQSVSLWAPRTNREEVIYSTTAYRELRFGPSKGNPTLDGSRIVVRGTTPNGKFDAFVFDIDARHALPPIHLAELPGENGFCSISPLGTYVVCIQKLPGDLDNTFILSPKGEIVQKWIEHHRPGHGDMTVDDAGDEVYVGISKSAPDLHQVIKRRLKDGAVTSLAPYGEGQHVSLRAVTSPRWAFVSYGGHPAEVASHPEWAPFAQEVIALPLDGSRPARRIAQTRNAHHDYWSETHASPSPDGSQVIWSSNWGKPGGPVFDFISRLATSGPLQNTTVREKSDQR